MQTNQLYLGNLVTLSCGFSFDWLNSVALQDRTSIQETVKTTYGLRVTSFTLFIL